MNRFFKYEIQRLLYNKFFAGLIILTLLYSYYILAWEIIGGVSNTAPFSPWSYGCFLSKVLPILSVTLLFFLSFLSTGEEKRMQALIRTTPIDFRKYMLLRSLAMMAGFLILSSMVFLLSVVFYVSVLHFTGFSDFIQPLILTLVPSMVFVLGLGLIAVRLHVGLVYALMLAMILLGQTQGLPFDLFAGGYFMNQPLLMPLDAVGEPVFAITLSFFLRRLAYSALGVIMAYVGTS